MCTGNTPLLPLIPNNHGCNGLYAPPLFWFLWYEQALISSSLWPRKSAHLKGLREMLRHIKSCWASRKNLSANLSFPDGSSSIITWRSVNKIVKPWIQVQHVFCFDLGGHILQTHTPKGECCLNFSCKVCYLQELLFY